MAKQGYISISPFCWETMEYPAFDQLKTGYENSEFKIEGGIPESAKLVSVIYLFEDDSLPDIAPDEVLKQPSFTVYATKKSKP